jgi:glycosyltransferase involved in cell wall biosynthesis
MRVLLLSNMYPSPAHPGSGIFVRNQVEALERNNGVSVSLVVSRGRAASRPAKFLKYLRLHLGAWRQLFGRHDVAHLHYASPAHLFAAWPVLAKTGLPLVVTAHGSDVHSLPPRGLRRLWVRLALRRAAAVIAVSRELSHGLTERLGVPPERIDVVDVGCDVAHFTPVLPDEVLAIRRRLGLGADRTVLVFVGNLGHGKGLDLLLDALERLPGQPGLDLLIVGSGPLRERLAKEFAARLPGVNARWVGEVPHSGIRDFYRAADLFVLPSRNEGRPAAILESMACGTPVVASRVGGIPEIIQHDENGLLFDSERSDLLATALQRLVSDRELRSRLARRALRDVESHSLARQAARVHEVYRRVAGRD